MKKCVSKFFIGRNKSVFARHLLEIVMSDHGLPPDRQNICRGLWISTCNISCSVHPILNGLVKMTLRQIKCYSQETLEQIYAYC